jgi:hypothetical protein
MNTIGTNPHDWDKQFKLMANIDLSAYDGRQGRPKFNMIGDSQTTGRQFTGVFDGNGNTISDFTYDSNDRNFIGLFSVLAGAEIKNLGIIDAGVNAEIGYNVGVLAGGVAVSPCTIENCYSTGKVAGTDGVGGLVGICTSDLTIRQCYSTVDVTGDSSVGGLIGNGAEPMTDCYSHGTVSGREYVGGLMGTNGHGAIMRCYSRGRVSENQNVGGVGPDRDCARRT